MANDTPAPSTYRVTFFMDLIDITVTVLAFYRDEAIDIGRLVIESQIGFDVGDAMVEAESIPFEMRK